MMFALEARADAPYPIGSQGDARVPLPRRAEAAGPASDLAGAVSTGHGPCHGVGTGCRCSATAASSTSPTSSGHRVPRRSSAGSTSHVFGEHGWPQEFRGVVRDVARALLLRAVLPVRVSSMLVGGAGARLRLYRPADPRRRRRPVRGGPSDRSLSGQRGRRVVPTAATGRPTRAREYRPRRRYPRWACSMTWRRLGADYERGDWAAALDTWSARRPGRPAAPTTSAALRARRTCWVAVTSRSIASSGHFRRRGRRTRRRRAARSRWP